MNDAAQRRLVDRLRPDTSRTGKVRRLLATTHNLQADFFDSDFLCTALSISQADFAGHSGQLALQRKLAELDYCGVLCEARAYEQRPSLRTVVHPVTLRGACLHAKLVVVEYEHAVRLLVGSANLTENGYRENREVCGEHLAHHDQPQKLAQAAAILRGARETLTIFAARAPGFLSELDAVLTRLGAWAPNAEPETSPVAWSDGGHPLWRTVIDRWPAGKRVERLCVVSPFWSEDGSSHTPLRRLLGELRERDALAPRCTIELFVESEPLPSGGFRAKKPPVIYYADFPEVSIRALPVDPKVAAADLDLKFDLTTLRTLHAKVLVLAARDRALAYAGSGNFTRNGFGFRGTASNGTNAPANIEAGWLFELAPKDIATLLPAAANAGQIVLSQPGPGAVAPSEEDAEEAGFWPEPLLSAELTPSTDAAVLELTTRWAEETPSGWQVFVGSPAVAVEGSNPPLFTTAGGSCSVVTPLSAATLQMLLRERHIVVVAPEGAATFPVNVAAGDARHRLPLSPAGAKPGESDLLAYYQGRITFDDLYPDPDGGTPGDGKATGDPRAAQSVDKSRIQAYQIRAFVDALPGIRSELLKACGSQGALYQAFLGEVSPVALAQHVLQQVAQGSRSVTAAAFQLVELLTLLRSVTTQ
ncbi:MAG TPA: hypothetical protein VIK01_11645, partial [Polyangiaceae bacterium]